MRAAMPADVIMPALGMAHETGTVLRWLKRDGEPVAKGEALLEVETDKVTVEIEAPADGTLAQVTAPDGTEVPVGTVIAVVLAAGETGETGETRDEASNRLLLAPQRRALASPKARRLAAARGVDVATLAGSGPNGAVVAADVESAAPAAAPPAAPGETVGTVWRTMAERTQRNWQEVPHFFLTRDVDASRLASWRAATGNAFSVTDLLVRICAEALRRHPRVNASWRDGTIVAGEGVHVAIAVATDDGVVAPVVHDADAIGLAAISERRRALAEAARAGRLRPEDVRGGTFTVSNLGMYGVDGFQAIVNAPQAAILAVGRIVERPAAVDGSLVVRPLLTLTLSFDHRVVDGARGAAFLDTLAALVEEPAALVP